MTFNAAVLWEQLALWAPFVFVFVFMWRGGRAGAWVNLDLLIVCVLGTFGVLERFIAGSVPTYLGLLVATVVLGLVLVLRLLTVPAGRPGVSFAPRRSAWLAWAILAGVTVFDVCAVMEDTRANRSDSGICACYGARYIMDTGRMPYGRFDDEDTYGPLLYVIHMVPEALRPISKRGYDWQPTDNRRSTARYRIDQRPYKATAAAFYLLLAAGMLVAFRQSGHLGWGVLCVALLGMAPLFWASLARNVSQVLPAALCVWAVAAAQRPVLSGALIALASSAMLFPAFVIPLWANWYRRRGWGEAARFLVPVAVIGAASLAGTLCWTEPVGDASAFDVFLRSTIGNQETGFYREQGGLWPAIERLRPGPGRDIGQGVVAALYFVAVLALSFSRLTRGLHGLIAGTACVFIGINFWKSSLPIGGYFMWYAPFVILGLFLPERNASLADGGEKGGDVGRGDVGQDGLVTR